MAKKAKASKKGSEMILGILRQGTSIASVYEALSDGRYHTVPSLKKVAQGANVGRRIAELGRKGARADEPFHLVTDPERGVKLVEGKGKKSAAAAAPAKSAKKSAKHEKSSKASKASKKSSGRPSVQDVPTDDED